MASDMRTGAQARSSGLPCAPPVRLCVEQVLEGRSVLVRVEGEIDAVTAGRFSAGLAEAGSAVSPPAPVVVDMTGVSFLGAAGLSVLVEHHERCAALGSALLIVPGSKVVRRAIAVTGLDSRLALVPAPRQPTSHREGALRNGDRPEGPLLHGS